MELRDRLKEIGFKELDHFTIGNNLVCDLERGRYLSISDLGGCNEFMYIGQRNDVDPKIVEDLVCIHNYDYDGPLTFYKVDKIRDMILLNNK